MFVFFFKQKTAYEMRISDWSSDVCSSDLVTGVAPGGEEVPRPFVVAQGQALARPIDHDDGAVAGFHPVESGKQAAAPPLLAVALPERLRAGAVDDGPAAPGAARVEVLTRHPPIGRASCRERVCQYV